MRTRSRSASPYESTYGFSRAIRVGNRILVSGTGPVAPDGSTAAAGNPHGQTVRCLEIIRAAIEDLGGSLKDVARTRMYVTDASRADEIGRAHGEFFRDIQPAATLVIVAGLVRDDWFVEIEAECIID